MFGYLLVFSSKGGLRLVSELVVDLFYSVKGVLLSTVTSISIFFKIVLSFFMIVGLSLFGALECSLGKEVLLCTVPSGCAVLSNEVVIVHFRLEHFLVSPCLMSLFVLKCSRYVIS